MSTTENGHHRETTLEERTWVIKFRTMGMSFKEISDELGWVSKDGAHKICRRWNSSARTQCNAK
ncbi:hypothetical protein L873DRAFT_1798106 [Choiromyces venosus 120613-1]|uniref:Myb-like domain-containing protein n=1 Tax=Choiromyces venosus 120613-1 TaxID=1336337 RepID=A0A3N4K6Z0_9PEZI|nr:hypothetical protein L873DRAFT_1798106 [Choiromyces venosus 120613-1]